MENLNFKFFSVLLIIAFIIDKSNGQQCNANGLKKMDATAAKLLTIGNSGRKFPENKGRDLKNFCDQTEVYVRDIESYRTKCMKDMPKQVSGVLVFSIKNAINQLCKKDSKRLTDLITSTPCANKANQAISKCYTNLIDSFLGAKHSDDKKKIPHICCEYYKMFPCIASETKRVKTCTEFNIEKISDFIRSILENVVNLICGDFIEGSDKCDNLGSPPKKKKNQRRTKSFIIPMVDVMSSFPEV